MRGAFILSSGTTSKERRMTGVLDRFSHHGAWPLPNAGVVPPVERRMGAVHRAR